jgi:two-component system cell cycle response regulator DivK
VTYIQAISAKDAQQRPDLILLDIGLPGEDGYQVLTRLRADPKLRGTRVVAVTARAYPEEIQQAKAVGFDGFIGKPLDAQRFPDQIRRILNGEGVWEI